MINNRHSATNNPNINQQIYSQHQQNQRINTSHPLMNHNNIMSNKTGSSNQTQNSNFNRPTRQQPYNVANNISSHQHQSHNSQNPQVPKNNPNQVLQKSNPQPQQQQQQQRQTNQPVNQRQNQPSNGHQPTPLPQVLPKGWKKEEIVKTKGILSGLVDIIYIPGSIGTENNSELIGRKFRSKLELQRYFGDKYDMSLLDYKTGKLSQVVWRKQRRIKSIASNPNNYSSASKYDTYLNLPVRQTASIFKQPVFYVTNNHKNEPTPAHLINQSNSNNESNQNSKLLFEKKKPIQLFWELRLNNMKPIDYELIDENSVKNSLDLKNISKAKNFDISHETELQSVAASCYLNSNKIIIGQDKDFAKNTRVFIDREQPLISAIIVKEDDIIQQEIKLKEMRKKLEGALEEYESTKEYIPKYEICELFNDIITVPLVSDSKSDV